MALKSKISYALGITSILMASFLFSAYTGGITGRTGKQGSTPGCGCHASTAGFVNSTGGLVTYRLQPGGQTMLSLEVFGPGGASRVAGINVAVIRGSLSSQINMSEAQGELVHTANARPNSHGAVLFGGYYTAPNYDCYDTIYLAVLSANGNGAADAGDVWRLQSSQIIVGRPTGFEKYIVPQTKIYPVYPNPAVAETNLQFELFSDTQVYVLIYNIAGELVDIPVNNRLPQGKHYLKINTQELSAGVYLCRVVTNGTTQVQKFVIG